MDLTEENLSKQVSVGSVGQLRPINKSLPQIAEEKASHTGLSTNSQWRDVRKKPLAAKHSHKDSVTPMPEPTTSKNRLTVDSAMPQSLTNLPARDSQFSFNGPQKGQGKRREVCRTHILHIKLYIVWY